MEWRHRLGLNEPRVEERNVSGLKVFGIASDNCCAMHRRTCGDEQIHVLLLDFTNRRHGRLLSMLDCSPH